MTQPQLGKQVGLFRDLYRRSPADREPLPVGSREVSIAYRDQQVDPRGYGGEHELPAAARSRRERLNFAADGYRHRVQAHHRPCDRTAGNLFEHNSLDGPGPDTDGGSQQDKDAMHRCALHFYDGRDAPNVEEIGPQTIPRGGLPASLCI